MRLSKDFNIRFAVGNHISRVMLIISITYKLFNPCLSFAQYQTLSFRHFSPKDGLSHHNIVDVFQDSHGFIWISTSDGLNRYDGHTFTRYFHDEDETVTSISSNNVLGVKEDISGNIIVASSEGIDLYDPIQIKWKHLFSPDKRYANNNALRILFDKDNRLWAFSDQAVFQFNEKYRVVHVYQHVFAGSGILFNVYSDPFGYIWVNRSGTLSRIHPPSHSVSHAASSPNQTELLNVSTSSIFFENNGEAWTLSPQHCLLHFQANGKLVERIRMDSSLLFLQVTKVNQQIWITTLGQGLWQYDLVTKKFIQYKHDPTIPSSLCQNVVNGVMQDHQGNLWVYTDLGLDVIAKKNIPISNVLQVQNKIGADAIELTDILSIHQDYWISTWGKGLVKQNQQNGNQERFSIGPASIDNLIWSMLNFDGKIWFGNYNGLHEFDPIKKTTRHFFDNPTYPIRHDSIAAFGLFKDHHKNVWISLLGNEGIMRYDSANHHFIHFQSTKQDAKFSPIPHYDAIAEDERGCIWMGNNRIKGLVYYDASTNRLQKFLKNGDPVFNDQVNCLLPKNNLLWIGTNNGLYCLNLSTYAIVKYTRKEGLLNNNVNSLSMDDAGILWIGTSNGLDAIYPNGKLWHFTYNNDLPESQIQRVFFNPTEKQLYAFTPHFCLILKPEKLSAAVDTVRPILLSLSANASVVFPNEHHLYELNASSSHIDFECTAPFLPNGENVLFAYKLEGFDHEWIYVGNRRFGGYTNLPPGQYQLHIKATADGIHWQELLNPAKIILHQPFYLHSWFIVSVILSLIFLCIFLIYMRYRIKMNQLLYGQKIRSKIAEDIHDDISSGLTKISWLNQILKSRINQGDTENAVNILDQMIVTTKDTSNKIGEIIWATNPNHDNLDAFLSYLRNYVSLFFEGATTIPVFIFPENNAELKMNPDLIRQLFLIIKECLHNVMKYANAEIVTIDISLNGNQYVIKITDNGVGFNAQELKGTGNGMVNMKKRTQAIHAQFIIESENGKGSCIIISGKLY